MVRRADAIDAIVGENIRIHRLARKLSQGALASKVGTSFQQLQKYEQGTNRVSAGRLWRISQVFDIPIHLLFSGAPGKHSSEPTHASLIPDRDAMKLVQAFNKVGKRKVRKLIVGLVQAMQG